MRTVRSLLIRADLLFLAFCIASYFVERIWPSTFSWFSNLDASILWIAVLVISLIGSLVRHIFLSSAPSAHKSAIYFELMVACAAAVFGYQLIAAPPHERNTIGEVTPIVYLVTTLVVRGAGGIIGDLLFRLLARLHSSCCSLKCGISRL